MTSGVVYWIRLPGHDDVKRQGYVGIAKDFKKRMREHFGSVKNGSTYHVHNAIRKYGWDTVIKDVIFEFTNYEECVKKEIELRPIKSIGWNEVAGGGNLSGENNPMYGVVRLGDENPNSKLKINDVMEILDFLRNTEMNSTEIAMLYGVKSSAIRRIALNISWRNIVRDPIIRKWSRLKNGI